MAQVELLGADREGPAGGEALLPQAFGPAGMQFDRDRNHGYV
jgi:hypothetical protein